MHFVGRVDWDRVATPNPSSPTAHALARDLIVVTNNVDDVIRTQGSLSSRAVHIGSNLLNVRSKTQSTARR